MKLTTLIFIILLLTVGCAKKPKYGSIDVANQSIVYFSDQAGFSLQTKEGEIHVQALDKDEDGTIDLIRYSIFDESGKEILEVEDSTLNGVINQRWHKSNPSYIEILYNKNWYKVHKSENGPYINVLGKKIPVTTEKGYLYPKNS
jgi:uncharacterized Fe-S center protein